MKFNKTAILTALEQAWSKDSARQWHPDNPALGQCNVTPWLVHELYGGDILRTPLPSGDHSNNRINGSRIDMTASQFDRPVTYADLPATRAEVEQGDTSAEAVK